MELPIICTLSEAELRERRREILDFVKAAAITASELSNGYAYEFDCDHETLGMLARLIALEHQCCPFLTFRISLEAGKEVLLLEVTGPSVAKTVIAEFLT